MQRIHVYCDMEVHPDGMRKQDGICITSGNDEVSFYVHPENVPKFIALVKALEKQMQMAGVPYIPDPL